MNCIKVQSCSILGVLQSFLVRYSLPHFRSKLVVGVPVATSANVFHAATSLIRVLIVADLFDRAASLNLLPTARVKEQL